MTAAYLNRGSKVYMWGLAAVLIAVSTAPILILYAQALVKLLTENSFKVPQISIGLLLRSLSLSLVSTLLCTLLGIASALFVWSCRPKAASRLMSMLLICALIPHFIHVHSWIKAADFLNNILGYLIPLSPDFTGNGAVIWTTAMSYLPFTAGLGYLGFKSLPAGTIDLLKTEDDSFKSFLRIIVPYSLPFVLTGMIFVFLITINDFAIPSVFGVSVYALELFALFSAGGNIYAIALAASPLVLLSVILLAVFLKLASSIDLTDDFSNAGSPYERSPAGGVVLAVFAGIPVAAMVAESLKVKEIVEVLIRSTGQISYSLLTSMLTAVIAVLPAALFSYLRSHTRKGRWVTILLALPFLIPSAMLGLSLISFWNKSILSDIYTSPVMPSIGLAIRFGILAILYMSYRFDRIDREITDAMKLEISAAGGFFRIVLPLLARDMAACMMLIFALSMGEYGIVLLLTPPGYQMVTVKIYNYIHYGASEIVFALNMIVLLSVLAAGSIIMKLYRKRNI